VALADDFKAFVDFTPSLESPYPPSFTSQIPAALRQYIRSSSRLYALQM
jgi:hypothetical protein